MRRRPTRAQVACAYTGREQRARLRRAGAGDGAAARRTRCCESSSRRQWPAHASVRAVGDAYCPGTIAAAVWDGRRYAEELDQPDDERERLAFVRETVQLAG